MAPVTHPILPAGFNSDDINGNEFNGAGTNWPVWPWMFDTFQGFVPLIITPEMMAVFLTCPDVSFPHEPDTITFPKSLIR